MELIVGNISTWSMRAWMCLRLANIEFDVKVVNLDTKDYKSNLNKYSSTGLVPVLNVVNLKIHDSLAIAEYANEISKGLLFPEKLDERAEARSLCSELHSGFIKIRTIYPFSWHYLSTTNVDPEVSVELTRLTTIWSKAVSNFYYAQPTVVDAFYSVMAFRLQQYGIELAGSAGKYQKHLVQWPLFTQCIEAAKQWQIKKI